MSDVKIVADIFNSAIAELEKAEKEFNKFTTYHEGYAVIKEELEELWDEIKKWPKQHDHHKMVKECTQIMAMAARFIKDLTINSDLTST